GVNVQVNNPRRVAGDPVGLERGGGSGQREGDRGAERDEAGNERFHSDSPGSGDGNPLASRSHTKSLPARYASSVGNSGQKGRRAPRRARQAKKNGRNRTRTCDLCRVKTAL